MTSTVDLIDGIIFNLPMETKLKLWELIDLHVKEEIEADKKREEQNKKAEG